MPVTATLITDGQRNFGEPEWLGFGRNGFEGAREYLCNTHDVEAALDAVPPYGAAWSGSLRQLVVVYQRAKYIARKDDPATATGGLTVVRCDYAEPEASGNLPPPFQGLKFTELGRQDETQTINFDLDAPVNPGSPPAPVSWPLASGDGFAKKVGLITARVYMYVPMGSFPDFTRLATLSRYKLVNSDAISLPRVLGTTVQPTLAIGQAQYEGFSHKVVGSNQGQLLEFIHELTLAPDHLVRWRVEDEEGNARGEQIVSRIYDSAPFTGLW